jgi:hypothetical protein
MQNSAARSRATRLLDIHYLLVGPWETLNFLKQKTETAEPATFGNIFLNWATTFAKIYDKNNCKPTAICAASN